MFSRHHHLLDYNNFPASKFSAKVLLSLEPDFTEQINRFSHREYWALVLNTKKSEDYLKSLLHIVSDSVHFLWTASWKHKYLVLINMDPLGQWRSHPVSLHAARVHIHPPRAPLVPRHVLELDRRWLFRASSPPRPSASAHYYSSRHDVYLKLLKRERPRGSPQRDILTQCIV